VEATTQTDSQGRYSFTGASSLGPGEQFMVLYGWNNTDDRYLRVWYGPDITAYTAGQDLPGGDFDIDNVDMVSPPSGTTTALPATFTWQRRGIDGETYGWGLYDLSGDEEWWTDDLGDVDSYQLASLPDGASYWHDYGWRVYVFSGSDGYGMSHYYRRVTFTP
jgi:hypothetical protein